MIRLKKKCESTLGIFSFILQITEPFLQYLYFLLLSVFKMAKTVNVSVFPQSRIWSYVLMRGTINTAANA